MPFNIVRDDITKIKADTIIDIEKVISTANYECTNDNSKIDNLETLRNCYDDSLKQAAEHGYKSVAFSYTSDESYRFTKEENLKTAVSAFSDFLQKGDMEIILVVSSKIRSNPAYQPKKITAVAFALALKLSLDDTKDFIGRAGYAFSPSSIFDLIIEYFIEREVYDIYTINLALFEHEQPLLGE